jgi:photosystem II stability/assembly factor-like uncharacterized protein
MWRGVTRLRTPRRRFAMPWCRVFPVVLQCFVFLLPFLEAVETQAHDPSAYGGVFRSRDQGASWFPVDAGLFLSAAIGLAVNPRNSHELLLASDTGLLRSRNGGRQWAPEAPAVLVGGVYTVAFDTAGGGALASTAAGLYRTDDGQRWQKIATPAGATPAYAIVTGMRAGRVYVAGPGGLWRSHDGGRSWLEAGEGLPDGAVQRLLVVGGAQEAVYAIVAGRLWRSGDGAQGWQLYDTGLPVGRVAALACAPTVPDRLWVVAADRVFGVPT